MKRIIAAEVVAIERVLKEKFPDPWFIPVFFPKITMLGGAYEWAKSNEQVAAIVSRNFSVVLIDFRTRLAVCAVDWVGGSSGGHDGQLKGAVCKHLGVPYFRVNRASSLVGQVIRIDPSREISSTTTGRLNDWQYIASTAFALSESGDEPGLHVLPEVSINSCFSEGRIAEIAGLLKKSLPSSPEFIEQYLRQMDVDALMVLDKPYSIPLFGFEYDGRGHRDDLDAAEKDSIKNAFFDEAGIPLLRLASDEHAEGLMKDPRGRADLRGVLGSVSRDVIEKLVLCPDFLSRLSNMLNEEALSAANPELAASYQGLARVLKLIGKGAAFAFSKGMEEDHWEYMESEGRQQYWSDQLSWFDCGSAEFSVALGEKLAFLEHYEVLFGQRARGLQVSAPSIENDPVLREKNTGSAYELKIESERHEPIEKARFERLRLRLGAGQSVGLSQRWLDDALLSAKRDCVLDKFVAWVGKRPT